jgi:hypothetical protein
MAALMLSLIPATAVVAQGQITLNFPEDGEQNVNPQYIYFSWEWTDAGAYYIYISQSPAFDIIDISDTISDSWYPSIGQLAYDTTYYWMVRSNLGEVSDNWSFTTMEEPFVTVTSPNGGEIWPVGSNQTITWQYDSLPPNGDDFWFDVWLSRDGLGDVNWDYIGTVYNVTSTNGTDSLEWTVTDPTTLSGAVLVVCGQIESELVSDTSDAVFTIGDIPAVTLNPTEGCSVVTISGEGFFYIPQTLVSVNIYWDGELVPSCPPIENLYFIGGDMGPTVSFYFDTMISVPTQNAPGIHTILVETFIEGDGGSEVIQTATAKFTVTDMTGVQGAQGVPGPAGPVGFGAAGVKGDKGDPGDQGAQGPAGVAGPQGPTGYQGPASAITPTEPEGTVAAVKLITGPPGPAGPQGSSGIPGSITGIGIAALVLGIACVIMVLFGLVKKFVFK